METQAILNKRISFCPNIQAKSYKSITLFEALNSIRTQIYDKQIGNIRRLLINSNIQSYRAKKKQLPAYIFSGIVFGDRHKFDIIRYTSLIVVDIDKLENFELVKSQLKSDSCVISVWTSPSGNGLKALFYTEYASPVKEEDIWVIHEHCAFPQIANYLFTKYGIHIDKTGADITRLCFVSSDPDIHLKKAFEPFNVNITLTKKQIWKIKTKYYYGRKNVRDAVMVMKQLSKHNIMSDGTADNNTIEKPSYKLSNDNSSIADICNKLHYIYSRICILINCVNYEFAERLMATSEELIATLNKIPMENDSTDNQIKLLTERFSEIGAFLTYLKSLQVLYDTQPKSEQQILSPLLNRIKKHAINNLINKERFQSMINELKSNINSYDISHRKALIKNAESLVSRSFRGAGCSNLRKWAKRQLSDIKFLNGTG